MNKKYKIILWGPGEIGGAVVRAALDRSEIEIVGAKAFSPSKNGKDLGSLVGIDPIGINATTSKEEILHMEADCVVVTPTPMAIIEGLDNDVIDILESGKSVVTSAAYHNPSMANWYSSAKTPVALLHALSKSHGIAKNFKESVALAINKVLMKLVHMGPMKSLLIPLLNKLLANAVPLRATPERLKVACQRGNASLHGTGVHPTFMAERVGMAMASSLNRVDHIRFVEAADFSYAPDGMWGGLNALGFGLPLNDLNTDYIIAKAGDFYYGDVVGNMAHLLYGTDSKDVRVESSFRGIPAEKDFQVGSTSIKKGTSSAIHMVHKGFIGDHHFFTNEECWYLGPDGEYRGNDLPFGNFKTPFSYTINIQGSPSNIQAQLSYKGNGKPYDWITDPEKIATASMRAKNGQKARQNGITNPLTHITALMLLDSIGPVCEALPGVVIDDPKPYHRLYDE